MSDNNRYSRIEGILQEDPHILAVIDTPCVKIPSIDYALFPLAVREKALGKIEYLIQYLQAPIILDNFGINHKERRIWRDEMIKTYGDEFKLYYEHNKLRSNVLTVCKSSITLLEMYHQGKDHAPIQFLELFFHATLPPPQEYDILPVKEKIELSNHVDKIILGIFFYLSPEYQQPKK